MTDDGRKFLILGQSRSGTRLLRSLLGSHPDIHCDGELLRGDLQYTHYRWLHEFYRVWPDPLLQRWRNKTPAAVYGCNLMFYHLRFPGPTLRRLVRSNWQVIHLLRDSLLDIALSYLVADRSGLWHREAGSTAPTDTLTIPPAALERELIKRSKWRQREIELTKDLPHRQVVYERDLADRSRWQAVCDSLFEAFRIDSSPVTTGLQKTHPRLPAEIIENFSELQAWLRTSRFRYLSVPGGSG